MTCADVYMDFETYCDISVVDVGAWKYSEHPSCEALCLAYSFDQAEPKLWLPDLGVPEDLFDAVAGGAKVHAHNAVFEYAIWHNALKWPEIPFDQIHCTMALVANFSYPLSLEKAGDAVGADATKDKDGKRLLRKFSMPRKPTKNNPNTRIYPFDDIDDFDKLCSYCIDDVKAEMAILNKLPRKSLSKSEQKVFELDFRMNRRGVRIDIPSVKHVKKLAEEYSEVLEEKVDEITSGLKSSQRAAIMEWAASNGYEMENYQAAYIGECLKDPNLPDNVRAVLEVRSALGKTSVTKYSKMEMCAGSGDKARGMVQYYGAQRTGRFAGRLIQVHNLPRGTYEGIHLIADFVSRLEIEDFEILFDRVMDAFSSLIRSMLIADVGFELFVTDFSNIEGRVLAWMSAQRDLVEQFARNDDVYKHMAATIFATTYDEVTKDERFVGKQAVLGCGYGMGASKFLATCQGYGQDIGQPLATKTVRTYRKKNNRIVASWYRVDEAASEAIIAPGVLTKAFKCKFKVEGKFLYVKLPSGRTLAYAEPQMKDGRITYMGVDQFSGKWKRIDTYGGKLVENIVQAVSRDLLVAAMIRAEERDYMMLTTVHDELVATREIGTGTIEEFDDSVREVPNWAEGCPIDVEGWSGVRYRK